MNDKNKPLCLRIEDAQIELAAVVNRLRAECGLPYFILEPIVKDLYSQILRGKAAEIEAVKRDYEAKASEEKEAT